MPRSIRVARPSFECSCGVLGSVLPAQLRIKIAREVALRGAPQVKARKPDGSNGADWDELRAPDSRGAEGESAASRPSDVFFPTRGRTSRVMRMRPPRPARRSRARAGARGAQYSRSGRCSGTVSAKAWIRGVADSFGDRIQDRCSEYRRSRFHVKPRWIRRPR